MKGGIQEDKTNMNGNILKQLEEVKKLGKEGLQLTVENTALAFILANIVKRTEQMEKTTRAVLDGKIG